VAHVMAATRSAVGNIIMVRFWVLALTLCLAGTSSGAFAQATNGTRTGATGYSGHFNTGSSTINNSNPGNSMAPNSGVATPPAGAVQPANPGAAVTAPAAPPSVPAPVARPH
jgi:hypothetical protein